MKKLVLFTLLLCCKLAFGQNAPDADQGNTSEVNTTTWVDLNDIINTSNITIGFLGEPIITFNLAYEWDYKKHSNGVMYSWTPVWEYHRFGYTYSKEKEFDNGLIRTTNLSVTYGETTLDEYAFSFIPYFNQMYRKNSLTLGYTIFPDMFMWESHWLQWSDGTLEWTDGAFVSYYKVMLIGMKEWEFNKWTVKPEVFMTTSIGMSYYTLYEDAFEPIDYTGFLYPNMELYYGSSLAYNITDKFQFAIKLRTMYEYQYLKTGYVKLVPYFVTLGANYDF